MSEDGLVFEALKVSMRQDKDGVLLTLRIHPNDVPEALHRMWVGQRLGVVVAALNDEEPKPSRQATEAQKQKAAEDEIYQRALKIFAVAQGDPNFKASLFHRGYEHDGTAESVHGAMLAMFSDWFERPIRSRTDFKDPETAQAVIDRLQFLLAGSKNV